MVPEYLKGFRSIDYRISNNYGGRKKTGRILYGFSYIFVRYLSLSRLICKEVRW